MGGKSATALFRGQSLGVASTLGDLGEERDGGIGCISADPSATWPGALFAAVDNS